MGRYLDAVRFAPQVRRYLDAFPRDQVHVSLFDDLRADVAGWVQEVQAFLGLAPQRPPDLRPANDSQRARSTRLHRLLLDPPPGAARVVHRLPTGRASGPWPPTCVRWCASRCRRGCAAS